MANPVKAGDSGAPLQLGQSPTPVPDGGKSFAAYQRQGFTRPASTGKRRIPACYVK